MKKIAIASDAKTIQFPLIHDDPLIQKTLENKGFHVDIIDWRDSSVVLHAYDLIIVSTTWNMHYYPAEFKAWLARCESDGKKRLVNDRFWLEIGIQKSNYLLLLQKQFGSTDHRAGSVIPTVWLNNDNHVLHESIITTQKNDFVIKPNTSADGENTYRITRDLRKINNDPVNVRPLNEANALITQMLDDPCSNGVILQPFIFGVEKTGEFQLIYIAGEFSHATVKMPGFKRSFDYPRRPIEKAQLPTGMADFANRLVIFFQNQHPKAPITRVRLDMFYGDKGPILSEMEFIEPNMNLRQFLLTEKELIVRRFVKAIFEIGVL